MRVTILGSGSAIPDGRRVQSGYLVAADDTAILVDCGSGVMHRLAQTDRGIEGIDALLLSHLHLDHVADVLPLLTARWLLGADPLPVIGPTGTQDLLETLRSLFPPLADELVLDVREWEDPEWTFGPFVVRATRTAHSIPCFAYRVEAEGRTVTLSGDTEASEEVIAFADGSDLLIHDCSFPDGMDIANHTTPSALAHVLAGADIGRVLLSHRYPVTSGKEAAMCEAVGASFDGRVSTAEDGQVLAV